MVALYSWSCIWNERKSGGGYTLLNLLLYTGTRCPSRCIHSRWDYLLRSDRNPLVHRYILSHSSRHLTRVLGGLHDSWVSHIIGGMIFTVDNSPFVEFCPRLKSSSLPSAIQIMRCVALSLEEGPSPDLDELVAGTQSRESIQRTSAPHRNQWLRGHAYCQCSASGRLYRCRDRPSRFQDNVHKACLQSAVQGWQVGFRCRPGSYGERRVRRGPAEPVIQRGRTHSHSSRAHCVSRGIQFGVYVPGALTLILAIKGKTPRRRSCARQSWEPKDYLRL